MTILLQVVYFFGAAVALFLFFSGIARFLKLGDSPLVLKTVLKDQETPFSAPRAGHYKIVAEGVYHVTLHGQFRVHVRSEATGRLFPVHEKWFTSKRTFNQSADFLGFELPEPGNYTLVLRNTEGTKAIKGLFRKPIPAETPLRIHATRSQLYLVTAILMTVIGANGAVWTIILGVNPHVFG